MKTANVAQHYGISRRSGECPRALGGYSSNQWDILMAHMRTLGNIPLGDSNAILANLKGGS